MKKIRISYGDGLLISFLVGIIAGTILLNIASSEMKAGLSAFPFSAGGVTKITDPKAVSADTGLFLHLLKRRLLAVFIGWLIGMTPYGMPCFLGIFTYAGLTMGVTLSVFTWQRGLTGLLYFLLSVLPHSLFYGLVWFGLAAFAKKDGTSPKLFLVFCLFLLCITGVAAECWIFPVLWKWGSGMLG